jgi:hypothetical protein
MQKLRFLIELDHDETHPNAVTPDQVMEEIQNTLTDDDSEAVGIQVKTVSVMPFPLP